MDKYPMIPQVHSNYRYQNLRHELQTGSQRLDKGINNYYFLDTGTLEQEKNSEDGSC